MNKLTCAKAPCKSCPYRKDVPSGVWSAYEYDKLPAYDGDGYEQAMKGGVALFFCHQNDGKLCAGWLGAHGPTNLIALRLAFLFDKRIKWSQLDPAVLDYVSPVPLFGSGAEAAAHGKHRIKRPGARAREMVAVLTRQRERK